MYVMPFGSLMNEVYIKDFSKISKHSTKNFPSPEGELRIIRKTEENNGILKNPSYTGCPKKMPF